MASTIPLFDRIIDVSLIDSSGKRTTILCPKTGPKPSIILTGAYAANIIWDAELKITNLYTPTGLMAIGGKGSEYKNVELQVGYSQGQKAIISGQIWTAYQNKPSPDGVTTFTFYTGWYNEWVTTQVDGHETAGTSINDILKRLCAQVSVKGKPVTLDSRIPESLHVVTDVYGGNNVADFCLELGSQYGIIIMPDGDKLIVTYNGPKADPNNVIREITYISDVKKTAAGYTITAPFDPMVRPNTYIKFNPTYFSSDLSGMYKEFKSYFYVVQENFAFSTVGSDNQMVLQTIGDVTPK